MRNLKISCNMEITNKFSSTLEIYGSVALPSVVYRMSIVIFLRVIHFQQRESYFLIPSQFTYEFRSFHSLMRSQSQLINPNTEVLRDLLLF